MPKFFTVDEANQTLPLVRRIVGDIVSTRQRLLALIDEYRAYDPDSEASRGRRRELEEEMRELTDGVTGFVAELEELGAEFKGFEEGLVDFHGMLDGREVLLCWKLSEESVEWWHELDGGYRGRRRLPAHLLGAS